MFLYCMRGLALQFARGIACEADMKILTTMAQVHYGCVGAIQQERLPVRVLHA